MTLRAQVVGALVAAMFGGITAIPTVVSTAGNAEPATTPTFTRDILPILQKSCQECHRPGQMAPMSLLTYEDVRPWSRAIKQRVTARYMPPWHLDRTVGEYEPDPSLSDEQIDTIARWVDSGSPQGDPKDAPPPRTFPAAGAWTFGEEPDLVITAPPTKVPASGADLFPVPEVASGLTEDRYIKWVQVIPESRPSSTTR
jgi:mono/diheme cytochrome c family protein